MLHTLKKPKQSNLNFYLHVCVSLSVGSTRRRVLAHFTRELAQFMMKIVSYVLYVRDIVEGFLELSHILKIK